MASDTLVELTMAEKQAIAHFASASTKADRTALRQPAEAVYFSVLKRAVAEHKHIHDGLYMDFMSEVTNKVPDLMLRATYRIKVIEDFNKAAAPA